MVEVRVTVRLKKGVSDPEGENTLKALHLLGFENVRKVQTSRVFNITIEDGKNIKKEVEDMCQRLLTNPVIHTYEIELL
ncbi:MAG: phosphoribosylformylglycinamidine synthase PurS protein [Thermoplasmata archaeon]|nr:MAG: phosphoribosylformylglycinamidine synthase PurS protein [Thermoplasmata archaeon]HEC89618.1 phosphoribosylformylglycinamidine synthase, purS protein [Thermoplasmatales archaeon]